MWRGREGWKKRGRVRAREAREGERSCTFDTVRVLSLHLAVKRHPFDGGSSVARSQPIRSPEMAV